MNVYLHPEKHEALKRVVVKRRARRQVRKSLPTQPRFDFAALAQRRTRGY